MDLKRCYRTSWSASAAHVFTLKYVRAKACVLCNALVDIGCYLEKLTLTAAPCRASQERIAKRCNGVCRSMCNRSGKATQMENWNVLDEYLNATTPATLNEFWRRNNNVRERRCWDESKWNLWIKCVWIAEQAKKARRCRSWTCDKV